MTLKHSVRCEYCLQKIRVPIERLGTEIQCPTCHATMHASITEINSGEPKKKLGTRDGDVPHFIDYPAQSSCSIDGGYVDGPQRIGRFEIRRKLGEGGFGIVYEAYDPQLGRTVALKVPLFGKENRKRLRRFITEARSAARLHHPNIVAVYENGETPEGQLYIASEFVKGSTLKDVLASENPSLHERVEWIRDLAGALTYAHTEGIIHRDVKPENILIDQSTRRPKLADFGLAKLTDEENDGPQQTQDGILGTPAFMSPEQARGETDQIGALSDQYSLGAVLYQCLAGRPPFSGSTAKVLADVGTNTRPDPLLHLDPKLPKDLVAICELAMSISAPLRYPSTDAMRRDLEAFQAGVETLARPMSRRRKILLTAKQHKVLAGMAFLGSLLLTLSMFAILQLSRNDELRRAIFQTAQERQQEKEERDNLRHAFVETEKTLKQRVDDLLILVDDQNKRSEILSNDLGAQRANLAVQQNANETNLSRIAALASIHNVDRIHQLIIAGEYGKAMEQLNRISPADEGKWEYRYLKSKLRREATIPLTPHQGAVLSADMSGSRIVTTGADGCLTCSDLHGKRLFSVSPGSSVSPLPEVRFWGQKAERVVAVSNNEVVVLDSYTGKEIFRKVLAIDSGKPLRILTFTERELPKQSMLLILGEGHLHTLGSDMEVTSCNIPSLVYSWKIIAADPKERLVTMANLIEQDLRQVTINFDTGESNSADSIQLKDIPLSDLNYFRSGRYNLYRAFSKDTKLYVVNGSVRDSAFFLFTKSRHRYPQAERIWDTNSGLLWQTSSQHHRFLSVDRESHSGIKEYSCHGDFKQIRAVVRSESGLIVGLEDGKAFFAPLVDVAGELPNSAGYYNTRQTPFAGDRKVEGIGTLAIRLTDLAGENILFLWKSEWPIVEAGFDARDNLIARDLVGQGRVFHAEER